MINANALRRTEPLLPALGFAPLAMGLDYSAAGTAMAALIASTATAVARRVRTSRRLARFVSPSVAAMVRDHGEDAMTTDVEREISVVCADIRNYTAFTATLSASDVMRFLREYYDAVGRVVSAHGATIKDYAGDGILVLVGATEAQADHAERALTLAADMRDAALSVTARWNDAGPDLGVGVGVASGVVALGMLGGAERTEFAAVGEAVNLSARLCGQAASGEVLMDARTQTLAGRTHDSASAPEARTLNLKGYEAPVTGFVAAA